MVKEHTHTSGNARDREKRRDIKKGEGGGKCDKMHDMHERNCLFEIQHHVQWIYTNNKDKSQSKIHVMTQLL